MYKINFYYFSNEQDILSATKDIFSLKRNLSWIPILNKRSVYLLNFAFIFGLNIREKLLKKICAHWPDSKLRPPFQEKRLFDQTCSKPAQLRRASSIRQRIVPYKLKSFSDSRNSLIFSVAYPNVSKVISNEMLK